MSKCEMCGSNLENFHAQGFDNKIYCPLCYFKKLAGDYQQRNDKAIEFAEDYRIQFQGDEVEYDMIKLLSILKGEE